MADPMIEDVYTILLVQDGRHLYRDDIRRILAVLCSEPVLGVLVERALAAYASGPTRGQIPRMILAALPPVEGGSDGGRG